jgi:hypothetical protein
MWYDIRSLMGTYSACRLLALSEDNAGVLAETAWKKFHIYRNGR